MKPLFFRPGVTNQANRRHRDQDEISDHCCSCHVDGQPLSDGPGARTHSEGCRGSCCQKLVYNLSRETRGREVGQDKR